MRSAVFELPSAIADPRVSAPRNSRSPFPLSGGRSSLHSYVRFLIGKDWRRIFAEPFPRFFFIVCWSEPDFELLSFQRIEWFCCERGVLCNKGRRWGGVGITVLLSSRFQFRSSNLYGFVRDVLEFCQLVLPLFRYSVHRADKVIVYIQVESLVVIELVKTANKRIKWTPSKIELENGTKDVDPDFRHLYL